MIKHLEISELLKFELFGNLLLYFRGICNNNDVIKSFNRLLAYRNNHLKIIYDESPEIQRISIKMEFYCKNDKMNYRLFDSVLPSSIH
jgi:hypothetical protein